MAGGKKINTWMRAAWPVVGLLLLLLAIYLLALSQSLVFQREITLTFIYVVLVVGLYVFAGNSGILSFGHMSFMAIGAYTAAIVTIPAARKAALLPDLPGILADVSVSTVAGAAIAASVAALIGALIAIPIVRVSPLASALAMFAFLVIVHEVASNWEAVTRGSSTMIGVPTDTTLTSALFWASGVVVVAFLYQRSNSGLRLRASREDEFAAQATGVNVPLDRAIAFVLSAFLIGLGGFLYAQHQGAFTPNDFFIGVTFLTIAMLVIGGTKSLAGAVVGAVVVSVLRNLFDSIESGVSVGPVSIGARPGLSATLLAAFLIGGLILRPKGLTSGRELQWAVPRVLTRLPTWMKAGRFGAEG